MEDVVAANLLAMTSATGSGRAYNVGAGTRTTVNELAENIIQITGFGGASIHEPPRKGDVAHSLADISAINAAFGWTAKVPVAEGLRRVADFY